MARIRKRGPGRRAASDTAWRWLTGEFLTASGEAMEPVDAQVNLGANGFELLTWQHGDAGVLPQFTRAAQWDVLRDDIVAYWRDRGEPMPAAVRASLADIATAADLRALAG